jgi:hypothetical protein
MADTTAGGTGGSYKSVKELVSASDLAARRKQLTDIRWGDSREWALNRAFLIGNQWAFYNRTTSNVQTLPTDDGDKPRYLVRLVSNQILPGVMSYIAMMTKTKPVIYASPDSPSYADRKAAEMGERLYEYWWSEFQLTTKLQLALMHSLLSKGYWKITWDKDAGRPMRFTVNPEDGQPIVNDRLRELFIEELQKDGLDPAQFEKRVTLGDICIEVMRGEDVWLSPGASDPTEAEYVICRHQMTPEAIQLKYGKKVEPDSLPDDDTSAMTFGQIKLDKRVSNLVKTIYVGYFKPSKAQPKGRVVVWTEKPEEILQDGPWYYPFNDLPIVQFPGQGDDNRPLVSDARPIQKELNRTLSQLVMHKNLTINPQMLAPTNSLQTKLTSEPGAVFKYNPIANLKPEWREMPNLPASVFNILEDIQMRLDRLFNLQAVSRGDVPPNVEAGVAIDLLQEAAVDQVAPLIQRIEAALAQAGMMMVKMAQVYYQEPRLLKIKGPAGSNQVYHFLNADLQGGFTFKAEAGSGLPRTRAGRMARIESLINMGVMNPAQAAKELDLADLRTITSAMAADEDHANREHDKLLHGVPLNPQAFNQWASLIAQGQNPLDGTPIQDQLTAQTLLEHAAVLPTPYENMAVHKEVHTQYMKTSEWETLPGVVQNRYLLHLQLTDQAMQSTPPMVAPEPVKTTLHLQSTVGPTAAAGILRNSGVPVTPEIMTEQAMLTNVYDSVDKPDAEGAGNDPFTPAEQAVTLTQMQDDHAVKQAEAMAKVMLATQRVAHAQQETVHARDAHAQSMAHADDKHAQSQEHTDQSQKVKLQKLRRPAPKGEGGGQ